MSLRSGATDATHTPSASSARAKATFFLVVTGNNGRLPLLLQSVVRGLTHGYAVAIMGLLESNVSDLTDLTASDIKPFIGARNFDESRDFYVALGWKLNWERGDLAELELGNCRFYLQRFYRKAWCENSMLHITVKDAAAWHRHVQAVLAKRPYGAARVRPPQKEDYGALVTYVWDPSGVLLHLAQPLG